MSKWGKTAVKQSGMAGCWIGANRKRMCAQASSLPPPQSHSQQARVNTTKSRIRQWLHTSDDLTAATVHPVGTLFFFHKGRFDCYRLKTINFSPTTSQTHCANHVSKTPERWNYDLYILHRTMRLYTLSHVNGNTVPATDHKIISLTTIHGLSHFSDLHSWAVRLRESGKNTFSAAKNFTIHTSADIKDRSVCFPNWAYEIGQSCNR